jgi:ribose transport system substrate-binding protein
LKAFSSADEVLTLRAVVERTQLDKGTVFRLLETLVETGLVRRAGKQGFRSCLHPIRIRKFRLGYASQSNLLPFTGIVSDSLLSAASAADLDLMVLNNQFSPRVALENSELFIAEKVDLVIDSQINVNVASQIGAKFLDAKIPFIAVDIPHPGAFYFGADNYKADASPVAILLDGL